MPIDYRAVAIDLKGRFVFGIGGAGTDIRIGEDEFCQVPDEKLPLVQQLYEEIFPNDMYK